MATVQAEEAAITSIQGLITTLQTDVNNIIAKLQATLPDADLTSLQNIATALGNVNTQLEAAVKPAPTPGPTPNP